MAVCSERGTLFVLIQDVAANGCQRFARYRGRIDYSAFYGIDFTVFTGEYRVRQFGYSSAITNMTLVVATAVTGYLAEVHWRLPFAVYLLPLISLVLSAYLKKDTASVTIKQAAAIIPPIQSTPVISGKYGIHIRHLVQLMLFYGLVTYVVLAVTFNLPFLMEAHHFQAVIPD